MTGRVLLLGGPAAAGKSTLAHAWCRTRTVAAHVQVDEVRKLVVQGLVDPLDVADPTQGEQWRAAVEATCALALAYVRRGVDVVVDDLMYPGDVEHVWRPLLQDVRVDVVVVLPRLDVVLARGRARAKQVPEALVAEQHAACARWSPEHVVDTSDLDVESSVAAVIGRLSARE